MQDKEMKEEKKGGQAVHCPTEERKQKSIEDMTLPELESMLFQAQADLRELTGLKAQASKMRDNLAWYIKKRRRDGRK